MTTRLACSLAAASFAAVTLAAAPTVVQHSYLVTVIADKGAPVTTLTASDFSVREGSKDLKVLAAEHSPFPLVVSLIVDMTKPEVIQSPARELRDALAGFVARVRQAGPVRIELVEVSGGAVTSVEYDAPPDALDAAIAKLFPAHPGDAVILEAIRRAAQNMASVQTPRRAIVTVDFPSSESASEQSVRRVMSDLAQSGATVWSVSLRLPRSGDSRREGPLNTMTGQTGGLRLVAGAPSGLDALLARVADSLASQYIVTFERDGDGPPGPIQMMTRDGLAVNVSPMRR